MIESFNSQNETFLVQDNEPRSI